MRDARFMRLGQTFRNLCRNFDRLSHWQRAACKQLAQGLPLHQLHRDKGTTVGFVNFVNRTDIRMVQRGGGPRLAAKTLKRLRVFGEFFGKKLQPNMAAELQVFGLVNHAHAAAAELAEDVVMGNLLPHGLGRRGHWRECYGEARRRVNLGQIAVSIILTADARRRPRAMRISLICRHYLRRLREAVVPGGGVEPPRAEARRILSPTHSFSKQSIFFSLHRVALTSAWRPVRNCSVW